MARNEMMNLTGRGPRVHPQGRPVEADFILDGLSTHEEELYRGGVTGEC